jgi:hypothetical protein
VLQGEVDQEDLLKDPLEALTTHAELKVMMMMMISWWWWWWCCCCCRRPERLETNESSAGGWSIDDDDVMMTRLSDLRPFPLRCWQITQLEQLNQAKLGAVRQEELGAYDSAKQRFTHVFYEELTALNARVRWWWWWWWWWWRWCMMLMMLMVIIIL